MVFLCLSWFLLTKGKALQAGLAMGLLIIIKQVTAPILLIPLVMKKWLAIASTVTTVCIGYMLAIYVIGVDHVIHYIEEVLPWVTAKNLYLSENFSLWTVGPRIFYGMIESPSFAFPSDPLFFSENLSRFFMYGIPAVAIFVSALAIFRMKNLRYQYGYLCGLIIIISPFTWGYYFVFALTPIITVWLCLHQLGYPIKETIIIIVACLMITNPYAMWSLDFGPRLTPLNSMLLLAPTAGVLILLVLIVHLDSKRA